jgi:GAF domain-containing protein
LGLEGVLTGVASFAVRAIPRAEGAGLTLNEPDRSDNIVKSEPFVREIEDIQYGMNEGPCISAAANGHTMTSGSLSGDPRWPRFGGGVGRLGVHSVLALPLITAGGVIGAINVYARPKDAFDDRAEHIGQVFAEPAAIAVQNAQILAQTQRLVGNLQAALTSRAIIDQAIGIIISRTGDTAEKAFDRIRRRSQAEHLKVAAIAQQIVEVAVRRARGRHP